VRRLGFHKQVRITYQRSGSLKSFEGSYSHHAKGKQEEVSGAPSLKSTGFSERCPCGEAGDFNATPFVEKMSQLNREGISPGGMV